MEVLDIIFYIGFPVMSAIAIFKGNVKNPFIKISSLVQEIIVLIETDPDNWTYKHLKRHEDQSITLPVWSYTKNNIMITVSEDGKSIRNIWRPAVFALSSHEKKILKKAFITMTASQISNQGVETLMEK